MLPSSEAELSTLFRELANEDWLLVTATGRRVRRQNASALPPPASPCRHRPRERGPCHEPQAPPQRYVLSTSVEPGCGIPAAPCGANLPGPRLSSDTSVLPPRCCRPPRRIASTWAMTVGVSATGCPITSMLPPRFGDAFDHNRSESAKTRPESSPDLPSHDLVPYRLDTPPSSPVTQRRQRLVSCETTWPRLPRTRPARMGQRAWSQRLPPVRPPRVMDIKRDANGTRGVAAARSAIPLSSWQPRHLATVATDEAVSAILQRVSARRWLRVSTAPTERHALRMSSRETERCEDPEAPMGRNPKSLRTDVTHQPTRRRVAKPTREPNSNNRPNTTASSLPRDRSNGCGGVSTTTDSPSRATARWTRSARSSQPSFATYRRRCRYRMRSPLHLSSTPRGERNAQRRPFPGNLEARTKRQASGTGERTPWGASRRTDRRILQVERHRRLWPCDLVAAATQALQLPPAKRTSTFAETPLTGELTRPVTNAPERVDRAETSLTSRRTSLGCHDIASSETTTRARSNHNASAAATPTRGHQLSPGSRRESSSRDRRPTHRDAPIMGKTSHFI